MGLKKVSDSEKNLVKKSLQKTSPRSRSRSCASTRPRSPSRSPVRSDSDDENSPGSDSGNPQGELSTGAGTKDERVFTQEEIQEMRNHKRYNTGFNGTETWKGEYDND